MIQITGEESVSLYMNIFALILILALISLSHRLLSRRTPEDKLFLYLCVAAGVNSSAGISYSLSKAFINAWSRPVMVISITVGRIAVLSLLYLWILYVDYRLNRSRDHLIRRYPVLLAPIAVIIIFLIINLFTGILFTFDENLEIQMTVLNYCIFFVNIALFMISNGVFVRYKKNIGSLSFFSVVPFLVPVALGAAGEFLCFYASETAGFAVGLIFMYFSMLACWKYEDTDPAFYNPSYLDYVCDCLKNGSSPVKSAVLFSADDTDALAAILKDNLPKRHETVHLADDRYLYLSVRTNPNYLDGLTGMIRYAADAFGCGTDDTPVNLQTEYLFPDKDETDPADWLSGLKLVEGT